MKKFGNIIGIMLLSGLVSFAVVHFSGDAKVELQDVEKIENANRF